MAATMAPRAPTDASAAATCTGCLPTINSAVPGWRDLGAGQSAVRYEEVVDATLDELAAHLERHLDCDALLATARTPRLR